MLFLLLETSYKIKMKDYSKKKSDIIKVLLGGILGYLIYYYILMDVVVVYCSISSTIYALVSIITLLLSIGGAAFLIMVLTNGLVHKQVYKLIVITYFVFLGLVFWGRPCLGAEFSFDLLDGLTNVISNREAFLLFMLNIIVLMPLSYFFRKVRIKHALVCFVLIGIFIESVQYIFQRGVFDVCDLLCYYVGLLSGYYLIKKLHIEVNTRP